jgi:hypothetical protein
VCVAVTRTGTGSRSREWLRRGFGSAALVLVVWAVIAGVIDNAWMILVPDSGLSEWSPILALIALCEGLVAYVFVRGLGRFPRLSPTAWLGIPVWCVLATISVLLLVFVISPTVGAEPGDVDGEVVLEAVSGSERAYAALKVAQYATVAVGAAIAARRLAIERTSASADGVRGA